MKMTPQHLLVTNYTYICVLLTRNALLNLSLNAQARFRCINAVGNENNTSNCSAQRALLDKAVNKGVNCGSQRD